MDEQIKKLLDDTGWKLLQALQSDARLSYTELGHRVGLSSPAVTERVRKMEEAGIITGYHANIDLNKVGLPFMAIVHIKDVGWQRTKARQELMERIPEVLELYRSPGDDSMYVKIVSPSVEALTHIVCRLANYGTPTMSLITEDSLAQSVVSKGLTSTK